MPDFIRDDGEPVDGICHDCQQPGATARAIDDEIYHFECLPSRNLSRRTPS